MMYKLRTLQDNMAATTETLTKTQERIGTIHILHKQCLGGGFLHLRLRKYRGTSMSVVEYQY